MGAIDGGTGRALVITAALLEESKRAQKGDSIHIPRVLSTRTTVIQGEIRSVDALRGRLQVRSERHGTRTLRMDRATRVRSGRAEYTLAALERGDQVSVLVEVDRDGTPWVDRVDVRRSTDGDDVAEEPEEGRPARDDEDGAADPVDHAWIEGRVGRVDPSDSWFTVDAKSVGEIVVWVRDGLAHDDERRLELIQRGDRIEIEVRPIGRVEAELVRFL